MLRTASAVVLASLLLTLPAPRPEEGDLSGTWKLLLQGQEAPLWLLKLESRNGQWTARVLDTAEEWPRDAKLENLRVDGRRLRFTVKMGGQDWSFEGQLAAPGTKPTVRGSLDLAGFRTYFAQLEPTALKNLSTFEISKDILARDPAGPGVFEAAANLVAQAAEHKAGPQEVRAWADKALRAAEPFGNRWQRVLARRFARALADQPGLAPLAVEYAQHAEQLLAPDADAEDQVRTLDTLALALGRAGKAEEADAVKTRIGRLEDQAYQEYSRRILPFQPDPAPAGTGKGGHAVVVELFTGAQCRPCVAADLAFDALARTYRPNEVILLQYHLNIPGADPLSNPDTIARGKYYDPGLGTPTPFFNGALAAGGGGALGDALEKYREYRAVIETLRPKPSPVKLHVIAVRKGEQIAITADVADLDQPGEKVRLRLALTEDWVRYAGANHLRYHEHVVRTLPGGADGFPLRNRSERRTVSVSLREVRDNLTRYLQDLAREAAFPGEPPSLEFKRLHVVAFVQKDESREVLQAALEPVRSGG